MAEATSAGETKQDKPKQDGSVKETIESILVAFILAFVFRAFVVEAFVIPTGSMGPTLMGAHMRITCPDCGYSFQVNYSTGKKDDTDIPSSAPRKEDYYCPNCGYVIPRTRQKVAVNDKNQTTMVYDEKDFSPVYFGDRILVLKYQYLFKQPDRFDVVVFKSPYESDRDPADPKYTDNYIKRLIGKPLESVMVLDGDIYIGSKGLAPERFQIQRKPRYIQDAMWQSVFDNDFLPHEERIGWQDPWTIEGGTGWKGPQGGGPPRRVFQFDNPQGASAIWFDGRVNHPFDALTDWIGYDQRDMGDYVSDLKLTCVYRRTAGQGPLQLQLTKRGECFTAGFLPGRVQLRRTKVLSSEPLKLGPEIWSKPLEAAAPELDAAGTPAEIEFSNVDYVVTLRINGHTVLSTTDADYKPDVKALYQEATDPGWVARPGADRPVIRINADKQSCTVEHLRISRDIYYINRGNRYTPEGSQSSGEPFWASPQNIMDLGPDEYFVMGDNSQVSLDARFWGAPVDLPHEGNYQVGPGRVPGRFMLGKAFFVYWPAGYRPESLPYGIRPDFGDMRFIH